MGQIHLLYELQRRDSDIQAKSSRLKAVLDALKETPELISARERAAEAQSTAQTLQTKQKDLELQYGSASAELKQSSDRMYSGKIKNSKELMDLQSHVEGLKRRVATLEEETLEVMMELETATDELESAESHLATTQTAWKANQKELSDEKLALARDLKGKLGERKPHAAKLDDRWLKAYENVRKKRRGVAVVPIQQGSCSGCRVKLSADIINKADLGDVVQCSQCTRFLLFE